MENETKKSIPFLGRLCAFAVACAVCALFCVLAFSVPRLSAHAVPIDEAYPEEVYASLIEGYCLDLALTLIAEDAIQNPTNNFIVGALAAQAALAALYIVSDDPAATMTSGNQRYFGGYTYYNGDSTKGVYFGSGYINNDARISRLDVTTDDVEFPNVPVNLVMICKAYDSNQTPFGVYNGANRGWSGTYYIAENYWGPQGGLAYADTTVNGDYVRQNGAALPLFLGSVTSNPTLSASACGATLCSGCISDLNSYLHSRDFTGDLETDMGILHDDFVDEYPDVPPYVWYNFNEEPTTETTEDYSEETTESGDDIQPFTLPPEWLEDYTFPVPTYETLPLESLEVVEPPTIELDDYTDGISFWLELTKRATESAGVYEVLGVMFVLAVLGFILWHLGS